MKIKKEKEGRKYVENTMYTKKMKIKKRINQKKGKGMKKQLKINGSEEDKKSKFERGEGKSSRKTQNSNLKKKGKERKCQFMR